MGGVDWIDMVKDKDRWWAVANAVVDLRIHKMRGDS